MPEYILSALTEQAGMRLDLFVMDFAEREKLGVSRTLIQDLIRRGKIRHKDTRVSIKPNYKIKAQDEFFVTVEEKKSDNLQPENIPLEIVYEDDDLAVINKQPGIVVHPAPGNYEHTLVNALLYRFKELSSINPQRPGIVHRLDKETSGLLVIAKNNLTHLALCRQFAEHSIKRKYLALVKGRVEFDEDVIELPIGRHPHKRKSMSVGFTEKTRYARTSYRTLKRTNEFSLLELEPFTGRTHQLRVHLDFLGHPILGDDKYGRNNRFQRLALHAKTLGFVHPRTEKFMEFSTPTPKEFVAFLKKRGKG